MNRKFKCYLCLCAAVMFAACGSKGSENHNHEFHAHVEHSQCGHDHSHEHEEHTHDHHTHEHEGHAHEYHIHAEGEHEHHPHAHTHVHEHDCNHEESATEHHDHASHSHVTHNHVVNEHSHEGHEHGAAGHHHDAHSHAHGEGIAFSKQQAEAVGLSVEVVEEHPFYGVIKAAGHIQVPVGQETMVVAASSGVLYYASPSIVEGAEVNTTKALAAISAKNLQEGDPLVKARLAYETSLAEYERAQRLIDDKIISVKEFEQIRLRYETAKTTYEGQAQGMTECGASVISPIEGYLKQLLVSNGAYVEVGQPIAVVTQTRRLQLRAEVSERDYIHLPKITSANFRPAYTEKLYKTDELNGRLVAYGKAALDAASHYIPVTFEFDNVGDIIPGSYSEVYLLTALEDGVVSLPVSALTEEQGLFFVYVQVCAEEYEKRNVHVGRRNGERVEILHGLHHGERVVTRGAYHVKLASMSTAIPHGHSH